MMWKRIRQGCVVALLFAGSAHAANPADPTKVIRMAFEAPDDGFDPIRTTNFYSHWISSAINEPLLTYDYLARPAKLVPAAADAMPEVGDAGKTYTFHIKKGIYFSADPAFKGVRRELTAQDFAYTFKRLLDPQNRSPLANFVEGKIVGLDALAAAAKKSGRFDYDAPVAGLQAPDRYTLRIQLTVQDYNFLYVAAYSGLGAVAREVIEAYGAQSGLHPVGTGAYMLQQYTPHSKIILVANPEFRGYVWDFKSSGDPADDQLVHDMHGKKMPQVGRVEISIIEEEQSRWLAFQDKQLDLDKLPQTAAPTVMDGNKLKPEFAAQGINLSRNVEPEITYTMMNFTDPTIGGSSKEKIALRRAIAMVYSVKAEITQLRMGQAIKAEMIVPPGVVGHDPAYRSSIGYDPDLANKLLDRFGYQRGADGYRTLPDGKPLLLKITNEANATSKIISEIWKRGLDQIGIKAEFPVSNF
ncbi:ABC transporter substrate-binding protein [Undibacterium arcticum]